ncbi:MAG: queuosine precursor transporter [Chlamydiota bacterium]
MAVIFIALKMGKHALTALFALQTILANLFVTKQMECFGLTVTCSDVYPIGALLSLNLLQEYFGRKTARQATWTALLTALFFVAMARLHLSYRPSAIDTTQAAFQTLLAHSPRIILASIAVAFTAERLDMKLYSYAKKLFPTKGFTFRFILTAMITQLFDTVAFSFAGLYGIVHSVIDIICLSYLIKMIIISTLAPVSGLAKKLIPAPTLQAQETLNPSQS